MKNFPALVNLLHNFGTNFVSKNEVTSENKKSKTFWRVGAFDDSTVNISGVKYSPIYYNQADKNYKPGFYGSIRLTRL